MRIWTLEEILNKVKHETDLEAEDFVGASELLEYVNEAIDDAEAQIHVFERESQYFTKSALISITQGVADYDLPTDIYGNKILKLVYSEGSTIYPIKRLRNLDRFMDAEVINRYGSGSDIYKYMITHPDALTGYQVQLFPPAQKTLANAVRVWYIRNANRLTNNADVCDIPEFAQYIISYTIYKIYAKEGSPQVMEAKAELDRQRQLMIDTLKEMTPDEDNELVRDTSHYEDAT